MLLHTRTRRIADEKRKVVGFRRGSLRRRFVLGRGAFQLLEFERHVVQLARAALVFDRSFDRLSGLRFHRAGGAGSAARWDQPAGC